MAELSSFGDSKTFGGAPDTRDEWRIRERVRTVAAGLLLCLHIGVDPPDVLKTNPTARLECWTEPEEGAASRETIARNLQQQFEFWQPRAKYRVLQDPTVEEVRKLCQSLRKSAKEERVLLHYNGHGVPRPTKAGELWLFNKQYTQYIPTAVSDVAQWLGGPLMLIADCSGAGNIFEAYRRAAQGSDLLMLVACDADGVLPMAPEMPADIFTACLTTPMEIAIRWHVYRAGPLMPAISLETAMSLPGRLGDRRTALGELNWILTAITDTIAWSVLPRDLFKRLFRQDVLVASLFRNYLLALRIMKQFRCNAMCWPPIPSSAVVSHELWQAWDQALDCALSQIPDAARETQHSLFIYEASSFFAGQLDAFEQWISQCALMDVPPSNAIYLPIVLQVLLSQTHRIRALNLLGLFMDLGDWAVLDALHVGVFPYILKLFQAPSGDSARYPLLYLWLRILVFDPGAAADLRKEDAYLFLTRMLCEDMEESFDVWETRSMAIICLCVLCRLGREHCDVLVRTEGLVERLLRYAKATAPVLAEWALHLLSLLVENCCYHEAEAGEGARMIPSWTAAIVDERLFAILDDERCENRAAVTHLLGTLLGASLLNEWTEAEILYRLLPRLGEFYPTARRELIVALSRFIARHVPVFTLAAYDLWEGWQRASAKGNSQTVRVDEFVAPGTGDMVRHPGLYTLVWKTCLMLALDPSDLVAPLARRLVDEIHMSFLFPSGGMLSNGSNASNVGTASATSAASNVNNVKIVFVSESRGGDGHDDHHRDQQRDQPRDHPRDHPRDQQRDNYGSPCPSELRLVSSIPMKSPIMSEAAAAFIAHQKRRKALLHRKQSDVVQARIRKLQLLDADDSRRWASLPETQRRFEHPAGVIDVGASVSRVLFHPLEERVLTADEQGRIGVWGYDGRRMNTFSYLRDLGSETPLDIRSKYRVTALACVDWDPIKLLVASMDGIVRLYDDFVEEGAQALRAAWSMGPAPVAGMSGDDDAVALLLEWNQHQRRLFTVAAGRELSVVDAQREAVVQRIAMPPDTRATAITSDRRESPIITLGFADGWLRRYDLRQPERSIGALQGHGSWIVGVRHCPSAGGMELVSGAVQGELLFWDPRQPTTPLRRVQPARHGLLALDVHSTLPVTVCASANQSLRIVEDDQLRGQIKYHEGLLGRRIGPVEDVVFHPRRLLVAAGSTDGLVSLFTAKVHS